MRKPKVRKPAPAEMAARMQAWVLTMLSLANEAFGLGEVLGATGTTSGPAASIMQMTGSGPVLTLAADIFADAPTVAARAELCQLRARAGVIEYWQIDAAAPRAWLQQLGANGSYAPAPPDRSGMHYTLLAEDFAFPVAWFDKQPSLLDMMQAWGLIDD
jgi:hypothetical protein